MWNVWPCWHSGKASAMYDIHNNQSFSAFLGHNFFGFPFLDDQPTASKLGWPHRSQPPHHSFSAWTTATCANQMGGGRGCAKQVFFGGRLFYVQENDLQIPTPARRTWSFELTSCGTHRLWSSRDRDWDHVGLDPSGSTHGRSSTATSWLWLSSGFCGQDQVFADDIGLSAPTYKHSVVPHWGYFKCPNLIVWSWYTSKHLQRSYCQWQVVVHFFEIWSATNCLLLLFRLRGGWTLGWLRTLQRHTWGQGFFPEMRAPVRSTFFLDLTTCDLLQPQNFGLICLFRDISIDLNEWESFLLAVFLDVHDLEAMDYLWRLLNGAGKTVMTFTLWSRWTNFFGMVFLGCKIHQNSRSRWS